jgi:hemolysin activation/secretion protein
MYIIFKVSLAKPSKSDWLVVPFVFSFSTTSARMNIPFPLPSGESRHANLFSSMGTTIAILLVLVGLPTSSYAQAADQTITQVAFTMPTELEPVLKDLHGGARDLVGSSAASPKASAFAEKVSAHLRKNGYPFASARATSDPAHPGHLTVAVKPGKIGVGNVDGNDWLSSEGVLKSILWTEGEVFNYGKFHAAASALNRKRFVSIDSKLRPRRSENGEIIVDADFKVDDSAPVTFTANVANDGTRQSSGWRAGIGVEWWEPFTQADRLALSWLADPEDPSHMSSYSLQYFGESGENVDWILFGGYSESETENLDVGLGAGSGMDIQGDGTHLGALGTYGFHDSISRSLALSFGITYLNLSNATTFGGTSFSDETLSLVLPRLGLQGVMKPGSGLPGRTFWSVGLLTDAGLSDDDDLRKQRSGVSSGFLSGQFGLTTFQPLSFVDERMGLYLNLAAQLSNDPLPVSIQKTIGGIRTVRGYHEREAFGDHGFHLNAELRLPSRKTGEIFLQGTLQPLFFYDYGYVSSEQSMPSVGMQSFGTGMIGAFKHGLNLGLHVGVPVETTTQTDKRSARTHFELDFRF